MENATEALMMAFAVLIFVLAISISISSFSLARQTAQIIIDSTDREFDYTYVSTNYDENGRVITSREVGAEAIIPTLYRAYKENYIVRFYDNQGNPLNVYQKKDKGQFVKTNEINLENESIGNQQKATLFIDSLLNGSLADNFNNSKNLSNRGFYSIIKENKFKEELGIYYIEDLVQENNSSDDSSYSNSEVSDINKTPKRVITYTKVN